jgi:hypothetical protein
MSITSTVGSRPSRLDLMNGDLAFRSGRDLLARVVLSHGPASRFSHVGVIVIVDGKPAVVHAVPPEGRFQGGVIVEQLDRFAAPDAAGDVGLFRIRDAGRSGERIREYALRQVGKPFDGAFSFADDGRMYCTELVLKALSAGGIDIAAHVPRTSMMLLAEPVVLPDHLMSSPLVEPLAPSVMLTRGTSAAAGSQGIPEHLGSR